jgi:L-amino acid N-acyltransferase YncA
MQSTDELCREVLCLEFRPATVDDVPAITRIYNQGIVDRIATLETQIRTERERAEWLASRDDRHPVFVAVQDGTVVGWASLNVFNPREAYRHVADFSVYVERSWRGQGVGEFLLGHLIDEARRIGFHKIVLTAFPFNEQGMRLYTKMGFRIVGVYKEQGMLDGRWVDTVIMEKLL